MVELYYLRLRALGEMRKYVRVRVRVTGGGDGDCDQGYSTEVYVQYIVCACSAGDGRLDGVHAGPVGWHEGRHQEACTGL